MDTYIQENLMCIAFGFATKVILAFIVKVYARVFIKELHGGSNGYRNTP